jgi:hypothetical protein
MLGALSTSIPGAHGRWQAIWEHYSAGATDLTPLGKKT